MSTDSALNLPAGMLEHRLPRALENAAQPEGQLVVQSEAQRAVEILLFLLLAIDRLPHKFNSWDASSCSTYMPSHQCKAIPFSQYHTSAIPLPDQESIFISSQPCGYISVFTEGISGKLVPGNCQLQFCFTYRFHWIKILHLGVLGWLIR